MALVLEQRPARSNDHLRRRAPLTRAERWALRAALGGMVVLGTYGFVVGADSTVGYLASILVVAGTIALLRTDPLPPALAGCLGALAVGHLAGGLVSVGGDVLYNAHPRLHALQYDHVFHASASATATVALWHWMRSQIRSAPAAIAFAALGALGVGALNELVEFVATLAHQGSHVGGYLNTGWDFVSNSLGVATSCIGLGVVGGRRREA